MLMLLWLSFSFIIRLLRVILLYTILLFPGLTTITCEMTFSSTVEAFKLRLVECHCVDIHWFSLVVITSIRGGRPIVGSVRRLLSFLPCFLESILHYSAGSSESSIDFRGVRHIRFDVVGILSVNH